jgi:hypothetical protein
MNLHRGLRTFGFSRSSRSPLARLLPPAVPQLPQLRIGPRRGLTSQNTSHNTSQNTSNNAAVGNNRREGGNEAEVGKTGSKGGSEAGSEGVSEVIASQDFGGGKTTVYRGESGNGALRVPLIPFCQFLLR